jgi:AcrR family transcriptional regulator
MTASRSYDMRSRSAAVELTRDRILDAAEALFFERWYDDVTIADVARAAGVSGQTVLNHFGGKEGLFHAAAERAAGDLWARRHGATAGDLDAAVGALVDDYEITGDVTIRMLAQEGRLSVLEPVLAMGRAGHREWVETMLSAPASLTTELIVATDVYTWKLLRRDQGLSRDETVATMRRMVRALLASQHDDTSRRAR